MDQRTRKLMTIHKALHPRDDVDRLYVSRKDRGRGLPCIEDSVDPLVQRLHRKARRRTDYRHQKQYWQHTKANRMILTRKQKWKEKQLYVRFKRLISNISHEKTWTWLRKGNLKRETESLLTTAQNNAVRTNHIKTRIDKTQQNSKCRLYGDRDETINHISECSKWVQKD